LAFTSDDSLPPPAKRIKLEEPPRKIQGFLVGAGAEISEFVDDTALLGRDAEMEDPDETQAGMYLSKLDWGVLF